MQLKALGGSATSILDEELVLFIIVGSNWNWLFFDLLEKVKC